MMSYENESHRMRIGDSTNRIAWWESADRTMRVELNHDRQRYVVRALRAGQECGRWEYTRAAQARQHFENAAARLAEGAAVLDVLE